MEYGMLPSTGTVGDPYGNAMAENADGAYTSPSGIRGTRNRRRSGGSRGGDPKRPHRPSGHRTPERTETEYYANQTAQAAPL